jgi:23S rRNA (cytosine1962-C5)-methyltransferase
MLRPPHIRPSWIVFEDEDIIVLDKPHGIACQAARPDAPDDLVTRLSRFRIERGDADGYVGVHQRLDRDTSGVLVYAKRRAANARLAHAFETRAVEKTYEAWVRHWRAGDVTLVDDLAPARDGKMAAVASGRGQRAETRVRVLERARGYVRLELRLVTGRTHQARVQLAHAGAPILGDVLYGQADAPRLCLHARALALSSSPDARFVSSRPVLAPDAFVRDPHAIYDDAARLRGALEHAWDMRYAILHQPTDASTTTCRIVNEDGDGLPRLAVDLYGRHAVVQFYEDPLWSEAREARVLDAVHSLGFTGVYVKRRPKQANVIVDSRAERYAPARAARGEDAADPTEVFEGGVPYLVRLGDGLSTGLFLDMREHRQRVAKLAAGRTLLNLFAYHCGFSVAAARFGALRTVNVDVSAAALTAGRDSLLHAAPSPRADTFVASDVFAFLERAAKKGERYDVIVLDPPSYATTRSRRFVVERDYPELVERVLAVLAPGGSLFAAMNHRATSVVKFRAKLVEGLRRAGEDSRSVEVFGSPPDFPPAPGQFGHLKCALVGPRGSAREGKVRIPGASRTKAKAHRAEGDRPRKKVRRAL